MEVLNKGKASQKAVRELFAATEAGSPDRFLFKANIESLLWKILEELSSEEGLGRTEDTIADQIRQILPIQEEAFLLVVIRKRLLKRFGRMVRGPMAPRWEVVGTASMGQLPLLPDLDGEVSASDILQAVDVYRYQHFCQQLEMEDSLKECSIFANQECAKPKPKRKISHDVQTGKRSFTGSPKGTPRSRSV